MNRLRRRHLLSLLLTVVLVIGTLPAALYAADGHTHTEDCYEQISTPVCPLEEGAGHSHLEGCYDEDGALVCTMEEVAGHTHTADCYVSESSLVCTLSEAQDAVSDDEEVPAEEAAETVDSDEDGADGIEAEEMQGPAEDDATTQINKIDVEATVTWINCKDAELPDVYLKLYRSAGGEETAVADAAILKWEEGMTSVIWSNMDETDDAGATFVYSVKEVDENGSDYVPDGYEKVEDGLNVTNTRNTAEVREDSFVDVTKTDAEGNPVYGATVTLYDGDTEITTYTGGTFTISTADPALEPYLPEADETKILTLKETEAPKGYDEDDTAYEVLLTTSMTTELEDDVFCNHNAV